MQSKKDRFPHDLIRLSELAKGLSHPARIAILQTLATRNECVCGELVDGLPLAQSTVSQHLKELRSLGLIKGEVEGPKSCYCINKQTIAEFKDLIGPLLESIGMPPPAANLNTHIEERAPACRPRKKSNRS